jgi:hypothetical protein
MVNKPGTAMDVVVLYSAGHLGSAITINKLIEIIEVNVVGVVKARPLSLSWSGRSRIRQQLEKTGWRFAGMLLWQRGIQALGYLLAMVFPVFPKRLKPAWKIATDNNIPVFHCRNINDEDCLNFVAQIKPDATQETVLMYTAVIGAVLTRRIVRRLLAGKDPVQEIINDRETSQYYPMPGEMDFDAYFKQRRFFRIRDVLGLIFMRRKP